MKTAETAFTAEDIATLPKTLPELQENVIEMHEQVLRELTNLLKETSAFLARNATYAADLPAPNGDESKKREIINLWRGQADHLDVCATAVWNQAVNPMAMRDHLEKMLLEGVEVFYQERARDADLSKVAPARSEIENLMHERAGNIASAYMGRVLPE